MIKFRTGVKIRSGTSLRHSAPNTENPLLIQLTRDPDLITIQYNGGGYTKITYTQGSGKTLGGISILAPSWNSAEYTVPFAPSTAGFTYKAVAATVWNAAEQSIATNMLVFTL